MHRFAASGALVLIGVIVLPSRSGPRANIRSSVGSPGIALAIALGLAALGIWTPGARMPAVAIGNLIGGFALFASLAALCPRGCADWRRLHPGSSIAVVALAVVFAHAALGGMMSVPSSR